MRDPSDAAPGRPTRRGFLRGLGGLGFAAMAAGLGAPGEARAAAHRTAGAPATGRRAGAGLPAAAQGPRITVRAVDAYPIYIGPRSDGLLDPPVFDSDDDPRRWRWGGPFEQLPSAIIAVVKTDQGIVGFGMGAGGSAAVEIIRGHLRHLLIGADPRNVEQLWDQMYSSALLYGRRGLFAMALSAVDNALWDIAGKHAGRAVAGMIGGWPRERLAIYQTGGDVRTGLARGIRHFKIGTLVGPHTPPDEQRRVAEAVVASRDLIGPDGNLMIDCVSRNGTADWAVGFARQLRPANLYFMGDQRVRPTQGNARKTGITRVFHDLQEREGPVSQPQRGARKPEGSEEQENSGQDPGRRAGTGPGGDAEDPADTARGAPLAELDARLADLRGLRRRLKRALDDCERQLGSRSDAECPVVHDVARDTRRPNTRRRDASTRVRTRGAALRAPPVRTARADALARTGIKGPPPRRPFNALRQSNWPRSTRHG
ncbi:MAG: hypothetical protein OXF93_10090 [Acidobacteria bacterium]|nr:hypothetical protein [Acidobacteriota bacterium]